ncbi:MAG: preprotein translocase subunit YajC [Chloroflexi bacterium]|nr:preprotein translocase subunit YajC [Chloroflexota bacterium]
MSKHKTGGLVLVAGLLLTLLLVASGCVPQTAPPGGQQETSIWPMIIFLVVIFALMYFIMVRPQRKRQKEHQKMVATMQKGDKVITAGGIFGTVESINEDTVIMRVESGATMKVAKGSVNVIRQ